MPTPYAEYVASRDPVAVLRESLHEYQTLIPTFTADVWRRPRAPGKWTAHEIMVHVAQWEMIFGVRFRSAVSIPGYMVVPMNQDPLMIEAAAVDARTAFSAFTAMRAMNLALAESLSDEQRRKPVRHPERGAIDVNDILVTLAGHAVHHLKQLQTMVEA